MSRQKLEFEVYAGAIQGARPEQEDASRIWTGMGAAGEPELLLLAADGLGGHASGEIASNAACDAFVDAFAASNGASEQRLRGALNAGNAAIREKIKSNAALSGMGTTLVGAHIDEGGLRWVSVGDSSAMLFRGGQLRRLNEDHSLGALLDRQVAAGNVDAEEARRNPRRGALRSALAGEAITLVDLRGEPLRLQAGDWVLLASDGLNTLDGNSVARLVSDHAKAGAKAVVEALLADTSALGRPDQDNTTVVALAVRDAPVTRVITHGRAINTTAATRRIAPATVLVPQSRSTPPMRVAAIAAVLVAIAAVAVGYVYRDSISALLGWNREPALAKDDNGGTSAASAKSTPGAEQPGTPPAPKPIPSDPSPAPAPDAGPKRQPDAPRDRPRGGQRP